MTDNVVPLRFNVEEVGKHVKASKKRFTWDISLNGRQHSVVLDFSFISGKVKVTVDRKILLENQLPANTSFQYPFTLDGNALNVIQQGDNFELRVNNKVFSHLYNQMKTNKQFKKYEDEVRDFRVEENQFQAKKLTLNIGGVGGGMKKKSKNQSTSQGHTWNAFGQSQMSEFPSYFQGQSVSTSGSSKIQQKSQKKQVGLNLLDQNSSFQTKTKKQQTPQNILQFQSQLQNSPVYNTTQKPGQKDDFSTMQLLFTTMNVNSSQQQYQSKQQVVIDNNEVDFFSSPNQQLNLQPVKVEAQNQNIDFFSQMGNSTLSNNKFGSNTQMFATTSNAQGNSSFGSNQGIAFNTTSGAGLKAQTSFQGLNLNMNAGGMVNNNPNYNFSEPPKPVQFNTMQNLFSTNTGMGQGFNLSTAQSSNNLPQQVKTPVIQPQNAINNPNASTNINMQHFVTQQIPSQNFASNFNIPSSQAFGTQNFGNMQATNINFTLPDQNLAKAKSSPPISGVSLQQNTPITPNIDVNSININDFSTMQQLFKTNSFTMQPTQNQSLSQVPQQVSSGVDLGFAQQFGTGILNQQANSSSSLTNSNQSVSMGTSNGFLNMSNNSTKSLNEVQSPNTMFMNTYSGSSNPTGNFGGFDMGFGSTQQFSTSAGGNANIGMMKKTTSQTVNATTSNGADLI